MAFSVFRCGPPGFGCVTLMLEGSCWTWGRGVGELQTAPDPDALKLTRNASSSFCAGGFLSLIFELLIAATAHTRNLEHSEAS